MAKRFLNFFFRYSGFVFNARRRIVEAGKWHQVVPWAVLLFFTELGFIAVSLPFYFLVSPKKLQERGFIFPTAEEEPVHLRNFIIRRKISLVTFFGAGGIWLFKIIVLGVVSYFFLGAQQIFADTQSWTFTNPADYTFDSATIEFSGGNAQLKNLGSSTASSTINADLDTDAVGWTYADWLQPAQTTAVGAYQATGGNAGGYVNLDLSTGTKNKTIAGLWQQSFVTNVNSPDTATLSLDWKSVTYTAPNAPITYKLYAFIDTASGNPTLGQEVWTSGEIRSTSTWFTSSSINVVAKLPTAGTYYLKIAAYVTTPNANATYQFISGFDNVIVNWSKTTTSYSTTSPSIYPNSSLSAAKIISWDSFTETATPNGGSINYQLSSDNGISWKYWNGSAWAAALATSSANSSSTINVNIASFPTSTNQINWKAFLVSNGSQQVGLSSIVINYTPNNRPVITSVTPSQQTDDGLVNISYSLQDTESDPSSLSAYEFTTNSVSWATMTASTTDPAHSGVNSLSASPAGTSHIFVWNALADVGATYNGSTYVRLRPNDGIANGNYATSSAFATDYVAPIVSNVSAVENLNTSTVQITYDLSDNTADNLFVDLAVSGDGGSTWNVTVSSVSGDVGSGVTAGASKTITWNAGADYPNHQQSNLRARVRARDKWQNQGNFSTSSNFSLDTLPPVSNVTADLQAQPNAGDSTALISGSFIEANPSTNTFYVAINGGVYSAGTVGTLNTASPSNQATAAGATLDGNDYISKVKIVHVDDYGQSVNNENTSPSTTYKYVKPYTPQAPTLVNPVTTNLNLTINPHASETVGLEYAIYETSTNKYVQSNGTLGISPVWQVLGTSSGQWGNGTGISGKINVNGLSSPLAQYVFQVKSRNTSDTGNVASSESAFSASAQITNTAPSISLNSYSQTTNGSDYVNINYTGTDGQGDISSLVIYQYSLDGGDTWATTTEKSGVGSNGVSGLVFLPTGSDYLFAWNSGLDASNVETTTAKVRLRANDSLTTGALATSANFEIDNKAPVTASVASTQGLGTKIVTITYNLTDANNSTVVLEISSDGGSTWTVATSTLSGAVGSGVTPATGKTVTWNAGVDFNGQYNTNMKTRVRATDVFGNAGANSISTAFTVDTAAPVVSNVTASQDAGASTFVFHYDVSENAGAVTTLLEISSDGGSTWTVPSTSAAGDLGAGITSGTGKTITWNGATDFNDQEKTNMKIRITANDQYTNEGNNTSASFSLDTKAPRITNVNGSQALATTTVTITYDLADQNNSLVIVDISSDSGSTWTVATTTLGGDVGSGVNPATGKTISWNPKIDFNNQSLSTMRVRARARDTFINQSGNVTSTSFVLDTLPPAANVTADLQAQPNAGDTTALIGGSFTETNPNTNDFYLALNGGSYGSATAGQSNTVSPSNQSTAAGATLDGNDYISKVKIVHTDDYGQSVNNENTSPNTSYKYVKPYTPAAPTVFNPTVGTVDVIVNKNAAETDGLEYAIFEITQSKYVQANGTLGASIAWQAIGTGAGQWGNSSGVSGKITVTGLINPSYTYQFKVKSRNTSDAAQAASSESALSSSASSQNQTPTINFNSAAQTTNGTRYVDINYQGVDLESETSTLVTYKYSTDNSNYFTMTEKSGVGSNGVSGLLFSPSPGANLHFMWDADTDLPATEDTTVYVRLQANDGTNSGGASTASAFTIDTKNPTVSSVTASQTSNSNNVVITYTLTDLSTSNVELNISNDGGSTWTVATSSVSGDVGAGVSPGSGRSITWNAGVNFANQEVSNMRARIRATDAYGNLGSFASSANFAIDTKSPAVADVAASQNSASGTVAISYNLTDANNSTVVIEISEDNGATWGVATTTLAGAFGAGVTPGNKNVTWNAAADFPNREQSGLVARVRATDGFANVGSPASSAAFTVDTLSPRVTAVSASQMSGARIVTITYNLAEANNTTIAFEISSDGGSTWTVPHPSALGDVGAGVTSGNGKTITWDAGADFTNQQNSTMMARVRGTDTFNNASGNTASSLFGLDTLGPTVNVTANLQAQPNAGDTTVSIGGSFTEANPNTNDFYLALNGGAYGSSTVGTSNTASPANQATAAGVTLTGADYISKVKIVHTDDYGQSVNNENTSPNTSYKYVKPYTPAAPTVNTPQNTSVDITVNAHASESASVPYAIYEVSTNKYVQANGALGTGAVWQTLGTSTGKWGNGLGISGRVRVSGLSSPVAQYSFQIKSRNPQDAAHAASSESSLTNAVGISNTAPSVAITSAAQALGNNYVTINYTGTDAQNDTNNLINFEYSTDNLIWHTMTEKAGAGSSGTSSLLFSDTGASLNFVWDMAVDLPNQESPLTYVRLRSSDGLANSNLAVSSAFAADARGPVISNITTSQTPGAGTVTIQYNLADNTGSNNNVQLLISSNGGSTFAVATTTLSGNVGANVTAGTGRSVTWNAGTDFSNQENSQMQVKIRATDVYNNIGSFVTSSNFTVDTKAPTVSSVSASQTAGSANVVINYTLTDISASGNLVEFNISDDGGSTWAVATSSASGDVGTGIITGSKSFTWNAGTDFSGQNQTDIRARVRARDYFGNQGSFVQSSNFVLDTAAPVVSNVTASQAANSTMVNISYDLADDNASNLTVAMDISGDGGVTWTVATATLAGDVGVGQLAGTGKDVTWNAGLDFSNQQKNNVRVRVRAIDTFGNASANFSSADFFVDTGAPVIAVPTPAVGGSAIPVTIAAVDLIPPSAPIIFSPANNESITIDTPILIGGAEPFAVVEIILDGTVKFSAAAGSNGGWQFVVPSPFALKIGAHNFEITAKDAAGNVSAITVYKLNKLAAPVSAPALTAPVAGPVPVSGGAVPAAPAPIAPTAQIIREATRAVELPSLPTPQIITVAAPSAPAGTDISDMLRFSGTALPNQEVIIYIHSEQALVYRAKADGQGIWTVEHSQKLAELTPGVHTIYAVGVDFASNVKSRPGFIKTFTVSKNFWVMMFNSLSLQTTLVTVGVLLLTMGWLYLLRKEEAVYE